MASLIDTVASQPAATVAAAAAFASLVVYYRKRKALSKKYTESEIDVHKYRVSLASHIMENYLPYSVKWTVARMAWYPTLAMNVASSYILPVDWFNRIDDNVVLGALPFPSTVHQLYSDEKVRAVINCTEEAAGPVQTYEKLGIQHLKLPIVDYCSPTLEQMEAALEFVAPFLERNESIYVHCKAGKGRSTTIVLGYLMKYRAMSRQQAQRLVIVKRPQVSKYVWRRQVLVELEKKHDLKRE